MITVSCLFVFVLFLFFFVLFFCCCFFVFCCCCFVFFLFFFCLLLLFVCFFVVVVFGCFVLFCCCCFVCLVGFVFVFCCCCFLFCFFYNIISNDQDIANAFNDFFVSIPAKLKEPIKPPEFELLQNYVKSKVNDDTNFSISLVNCSVVSNYISSIYRLGWIQ